MRNTTTPQLFRSMEGKTYRLGRMTMAFKRTDGEDEGSSSDRSEVIACFEPT